MIQTTAILSRVVSMLIRTFPLRLLHVPRPLCRTTWLLFVSEVKTHAIDGIMLHIFGEQAAPQFEPTDSQHKLPKICHGTTSTEEACGRCHEDLASPNVLANTR